LADTRPGANYLLYPRRNYELPQPSYRHRQMPAFAEQRYRPLVVNPTYDISFLFELGLITKLK
jgi:hypothetical protein